ncbi:MAG: hypothetical protein ACJ76F_00995 [Bacteroidia bacterium]
MKKTSIFMQICIGISIILLSGGFFLRSMNQANAAPALPGKLQQSTGSIGKYQMCANTVTVGDKFFQYVLVWNTETGQSKYYYYDRYDDRTFTWIPFGKDLPEKPL